jgi:hypothetical protein
VSAPEKVADILPRVLAHVFGAIRFEYGSSVARCRCGLITRHIDGRWEYWRWRGSTLEKVGLPPPCTAQDAA